MADKRKGKKRKEELPFLEEKVEKPSKEEYKIAKWLKKNVSVKRTKFLHHNVEYFTGAKAVDALLNSPWSASTNESEEPKFTTRQDVTDYLDQMLRHKFFHRAKKVPVTEQELRAKQKKKKEKEQKKEKDSKEEKKEEKEEKKRREEETAESSHAEGKESESGKLLQPEEQREKKKMKIRLEMHIDQYFVDSLDAYVWIYDPIPVYYWLFGFLLVIGAILICMFPLWPSSVRMGVYYLSVATAGFLMLIIALAFLRLVVFCLLWLATLGAHHLWLFPNLTEDVGFFASFWPLYQYEYKGRGSTQKSKKKKKAKDSDEEEEEEEDEASEAENSSKTQNTDDGGGGGGGEEEGVRRRKQQSSGGEENEKEEGKREEEKEEEEEEEEEDTESEGSSQQSQTGKDFEMVDKSEVASS